MIVCSDVIVSLAIVCVVQEKEKKRAIEWSDR